MAVPPEYASDVAEILSHRHDLGFDYWTTPDHRLIKGAPFSAIECANYLLELGVAPSDPVLQGVAELCWEAQLPDGRFKVYPTGSPLPCQYAPVVDLLARLGFAHDPRLLTAFNYLLETRYSDGGWRCKRFPFGPGPGDEYSNPMPTLDTLAAFMHAPGFDGGRGFPLDSAVEFLLAHWEFRTPIGPCRYGIGTLFCQVEYPFRGYNIFYYLWVLSHYEAARTDARFLDAFEFLTGKLDSEGRIIVERVVPKLARLHFCAKGQPSELATVRYREIAASLG